MLQLNHQHHQDFRKWIVILILHFRVQQLTSAIKSQLPHALRVGGNYPAQSLLLYKPPVIIQDAISASSIIRSAAVRGTHHRTVVFRFRLTTGELREHSVVRDFPYIYICHLTFTSSHMQVAVSSGLKHLRAFILNKD